MAKACIARATSFLTMISCCFTLRLFMLLQLRPLVDALVVSTRDRMMQLLSQAYSLLSPAKAASLLGVSEQEAAALAEGAGWRQDMESGMFITQLPATVDVPLEGFDQLTQLAEYVVHLESS